MPFSYAVANSVDSFEAFIRLASHAETLAVNRRHSQAEEGRWSIDSNRRSHSSADNFASSDPNNFVTAPKNAANSCSARLIEPAQSGSFGCLSTANRFICLTSLPILTNAQTSNKTENVSELQ